MIDRDLKPCLLQQLQSNAAVVLMGARQIGKTTLALEVSQNLNAVYRDLENPEHRAQMEDINLFAKAFPNNLIILDEVQHVPEIFAPIRGIIDENRRQGRENGQFLFLGSSSLELLNQASESLAGRISYAELSGVNVLELRKTTNPDIDENTLWLRGGFPRSLLAADDEASLEWRENIIRSYLERDVPQFGFRVPAETLRRFWTMLAHHQCGLFNAASLARGLDVTGHSISHYLDILVDLLLVRRLPPWHANIGKRLVKSPRIYIRDSGFLHALLNISSLDELFGHPIIGDSWEGYVIENLISVYTELRYTPYFYRTQTGAEIDLVFEKGGVPKIAIEIKRSSAPKPAKGFHIACDDLGIEEKYLVYPGDTTYQRSSGVTIIPLHGLMQKARSFT
jgi:hypothetical protein